jgi:Domain of unknown function (DUF4342)
VPEPTYWESIKSESGAVLERLKQLVHEGNVRSIRVRQGDRVVAVFPLTAGVVGIVLAPALAAVATLLALLGECSIDIERVEKDEDRTKGSGEDRVAV